MQVNMNEKCSIFSININIFSLKYSETTHGFKNNNVAHNQ